MLTRAGKKHIRTQLSRHIAATSAQLLRLPWLSSAAIDCLEFSPTPSRCRPNSGLARSRGTTADNHKASSNASTRHLATEAAAFGTLDDFVPFEDLSPHLKRPYQPPEWGLATVKPFDRKNVMVVQPRHQSDYTSVRRERHSGISGDTIVLQENLYALIRVGRYDQAAKVVRRMGKVFLPHAPELIDAHHRFLTGRLEALLANPSRDKFKEIQRWFELDIRGRGSAPNSGILAIMIKASFAVLDDTRLDRTIRRYTDVAGQLGTEVKEDVLTSNLFLESELARMLRLFPREFDPPQLNDFANDTSSSIGEVDSVEASENSFPADASATPIPAEVRPTEMRGFGLKALKMSLGSLSPETQRQHSLILDTEKADYARQKQLESDVLEAALERWREDMEMQRRIRAQGMLNHPLLGSYVFEWIQEMVVLVKKEIKASEAAEEGRVQSKDVDKLLLGPFLKIVKPEKLCAAALIAYVNHISESKEQQTSDRTLVSTVSKIGTAVSKEIQAERIKNSVLEKFDSLPSPERKKRLAKLLRQHRGLTKAKALSSASELDLPPSPHDLLNITVRAKLGALFLSFFMKIAKLPVSRKDPTTGQKVTQNLPVASHSWTWRVGKRVGMVKTSSEFIDRLKREPVGAYIAKFLPMVIPPRPWKDLDGGPYLDTPLQAVRFRDTSRSQQDYIQMAEKRGDMKQTYAALDVIGKVPWRVNTDLFHVLAEAWDTGEAIGGLAPENPPENWPERPPQSDRVAYRRWRALIKAYQNERTGFHSQRCYQNFQLEVARSYLGKTFYCPHNVDFRGRAYPIPPYFNHMGADYVRGLFMFANGKALGETGMKWLKIHLANVYGYDKASLKDREAFTMEHIDDVFDSAANPLSGRRWWLTSDDPWQTLAACMELKKALESPEPTEFISHIPVQQDGTCNGLQHYAALGGDIIGAQQVNLMPSDKPADIYTAVAEMVKQDIRDAAARGEKPAKILDGKITRKVVKQPVMTNVYGVTYHGAKEQVQKQLEDILPKASLDDEFHISLLSRYVAVLIFKSLSSMFHGAHAIQSWLGECGSRISHSVTPEQIERLKARRAGTLVDSTKLKRRQLVANARQVAKEDYQFKSTIVWTSPLGMPVVQPYRDPKFKSIKTSIQDLNVQEASVSDPVSKRKQLQGFPPNFIHSLDATHMMLSALKCDELGLQFSSVHDSFWTHAADVPIMNRILRDAFVRMHTEDVVGRLREEFIARYKGCMRYTPIDARSPLAKRIRQLRKDRGTDHAAFLGATVRDGVQVDELLEEYERMRLLNSDDPEEQMKGRDMLTPGSLFQSEADSTYLVSEAKGHVRFLGQHSEEDAKMIAGSAEPDLNSEDSNIDEIPFELDVNAEMGMAESDHSEEASALAPIPDAIPEPAPASANLPEKDPEEEAKPKEIKAKKAKPKQWSKLFLWLPMEFPEAPPKGEFDVASLKDSQYFFS